MWFRVWPYVAIFRGQNGCGPLTGEGRKITRICTGNAMAMHYALPASREGTSGALAPPKNALTAARPPSSRPGMKCA